MNTQLLPCPFCGGEAESDSSRAFRGLLDVKIHTAVAIYCTKCSADMSMVHEDHPEYCVDDMMTMLTDSWNIRTPPPADTVSKIEGEGR